MKNKFFALIAFLLINSFILAQDQNEKQASECDKIWIEVTELLIQKRNIQDADATSINLLLLEKLQVFIELDNVDVKRKNFAVSLIVNMMSELEMYSEFLKFSEKYIAEPTIIDEIKIFLKESRIKVLFDTAKFDELVKEADEYLAELPQDKKLAGSQKLKKGFFILYKAKGLIMLSKPQNEQIEALTRLKGLQEGEKNPEILYQLKNIERSLRHFISIHPGAELATWTLKNIDGAEVKLADYKGKLLILVFWQSWQGSSKTLFDNYLKKYSARFENLKILGLSNEDADKQKEFVKENNIPWTSLVDAESQLYREYSILNMPYVILLDEQNKVVISGSFEVMHKIEKFLVDKNKSLKPDN